MNLNRIKPLGDTRAHKKRVFKHLIVSLIVLAFSLGVGVVGYHSPGDLGWIDAFLNAAMILTGMGPVNMMNSDSGKLFAAFYALFSGLAFVTVSAIILAPAVHRFLHQFHIDIREDETEK